MVVLRGSPSLVPAPVQRPGMNLKNGVRHRASCLFALLGRGRTIITVAPECERRVAPDESRRC